MKSLMGGLMLRVGLGLAVAIVAVGWLFWQTLENVGNLAQDEMLRRQANDLLPAFRRSRQGEVNVDLGGDALNIYRNMANGFMYVVHDGSGRILKSSQPSAPLLLQKGLVAASAPAFMNTEQEDGTNARYMMVRPLWQRPKPVYLTVAQLRTIDDVLLEQAGREALTNLLFWLVPCLLIGLALVGSTLNRGLAPLRALSEAVGNLGTRRLDKQLASENLPNEIRPLAYSINNLREHLAQVLDSQRQLTADMAHQLKTPLAIMQARLELLAPLPGRDDLLRDVTRMARLIQQMLHFSQVLETDTELVALDLAPVVEDVVARLAPLADRADVTLRYTAPSGPVNVRGEALLLAEAVQNLVDNAIQHTGAGRHVDVIVRESGEVEVQDRGPGVPALEKTLVFSRFWRADEGFDTPSGSGLGLAIVAEIARRHGGRVWVGDREGGGAIFGLALPLNI